MQIYNTLSRKVEEFKPINPNLVTMYTCGPTVYNYVHIGNFRTYTTADILLRTLKYNGYKIKYIMNITDVGHLTGDNLGDADVGEDRLEKAARAEHKTAWDVAERYTKIFLQDYEKLNLTLPDKFTKATDYIQEQINLINILKKKGYTYIIDDGVYFDTAKFPEYGKLSFLDLKNLRPASRIEPNPQKKNPSDFALWKFTPRPGSGQAPRQMEWDSPWAPPGARGKARGFPGWHIECSAMSMKNLGETIDIHVGGEDLAATHHPNEIAQSEAATDKEFVRYWVHGAFLLVDSGRMGRSIGNTYTITDLEKKGFKPLALRYLYLTAKYGDKLNFTWDSLQSAQNALNNLYAQVSSFEEPKGGSPDFEEKFLEVINNDLKLPQALSVVWELVRSQTIASSAKMASLEKMDQVLGLDLTKQKKPRPAEIKKLISQREEARESKDFELADKIRKQLFDKGFEIEDTPLGPRLKRIFRS